MNFPLAIQFAFVDYQIMTIREDVDGSRWSPWRAFLSWLHSCPNFNSIWKYIFNHGHHPPIHPRFSHGGSLTDEIHWYSLFTGFLLPYQSIKECLYLICISFHPPPPLSSKYLAMTGPSDSRDNRHPHIQNHLPDVTPWKWIFFSCKSSCDGSQKWMMISSRWWEVGMVLI